MDVTEETVKEVILADYQRPSLKEGTYRITVKQDAQTLGKTQISRKFTVGGSNIGFHKGEVHSVFPTVNGDGHFATVLPHVVWNRASLPWEVKVNDDAEQPWLWLLLLSGEEVAEIRTAAAKDAFSGGLEDIFIPAADMQDPEQSCMYIDVDREKFLELCPPLEDIKYLCHVRKGVEEENAVRQADEAQKGAFAVTFCGRLPMSGPEKVQNRVYVVSLEGYGAGEAMTEEAEKYPRVRLLVLYSWDFYSTDNGMEPDAVFKELQFRVPASEKCIPAEQARETCDEVLNGILENGYVPVKHWLQNGDRTVSFYRGPLVPLRLEKRDLPAFSAKELYFYDPNLGMFDVSLACAWQLGRLLTLHQSAVAEQLIKERRKSLQSLHGAALREQFNEYMGRDAGNPYGNENPADVLLDILEKALPDGGRKTEAEEETGRER